MGEELHVALLFYPATHEFVLIDKDQKMLTGHLEEVEKNISLPHNFSPNDYCYVTYNCVKIEFTFPEPQKENSHHICTLY